MNLDNQVTISRIQDGPLAGKFYASSGEKNIVGDTRLDALMKILALLGINEKIYA